jgi:hypothetical protein
MVRPASANAVTFNEVIDELQPMYKHTPPRGGCQAQTESCVNYYFGGEILARTGSYLVTHLGCMGLLYSKHGASYLLTVKIQSTGTRST